jgi:PKD repeat protein
VTINGVTLPGTGGAAVNRLGWEWGDGTSEEHWFPATHSYGKAGEYTVKVTSYQNDGLTTTKPLTLVVQP